MTLQLILPRSAGAKYVCRVPTMDGPPCGRKFGPLERGVFERHVIACSKRNEDAVQAERPSNRVPVMFDPDFWDREYEEYMAKVGEKMTCEGRIEQRPNEH